jgi:hypothetical protein
MRSERISGLVLILFSVLIMVESRKYPIGTVDNPGPGFLPMLLGFLLGLMSLALWIKTWIKVKTQIQKTSWPDRQGLFKIIAIFIGILLFTILFEVTGYFLNIFLLFLLLLRPIGRQRWSMTLMISIGAVLVSYLLFDWWLKVPLPRGVWFQ